MMEYVIEKNVPIPEKPRGKGLGGLTKALIAMEVGDSILSERDAGKMGGFYASVAKHAPGRKYVGRKVDGGSRIWRVK